MNNAWHWAMAMLAAHPKTCVVVGFVAGAVVGHLV